MGWAIASPGITASIRKVHDFLTVGAAHPLQIAAAAALKSDESYYATLAGEYRERRDFLVNALRDAGFRVFDPLGAYYIMTDISDFGFPDDLACSLHLVEHGGVATVPGSAFYSRPELGRTKIRFCFPKRMETLHQAAERLTMYRS